jgi:hypothetical protein
MVDEPVADLRHADSSSLLVVSDASLSDRIATHIGEDCLLFLAGIRIRDVL